jgi:hypothetical protein
MTNGTWAEAIDLGSGYGTVTYDGTQAELHYKFTPPAGETITVSSNEPDYYLDVYEEAVPWDIWVEYSGGRYGQGSWLTTGITYHVVLYPNQLPTPQTVYGLTWGLPDFSQGHWSGWIQSPPNSQTAGLTTIRNEPQPQPAYGEGVGSGPLSRDNAVANLPPWSNDVWWAWVNAYGTNGDKARGGYGPMFSGRPLGAFGQPLDPDIWWTQIYLSRTGLQVAVSADWEMDRGWEPPELDALVEGTDYTYAPGTRNYAQYEDLPNTFLGWSDQEYPYGYADPITYGLNALWSGSTQDVGGNTLRLSIYEGGFDKTDHAVDEGHTLENAFLTTPWPEHGGSVIANVSIAGPALEGGDSPGSSGTVILNPASWRFMLAALPLEIPQWSSKYWYGQGSSLGLTAKPKLFVQRPRWRYWIPGPSTPPFLRQIQRNDGLGRSVWRARGASSVQGSNRVIGHR